MTAEEMWNLYVQKAGLKHAGYEAWAFGDEPDKLASLVAGGQKTATSSAFPLYELEQEPLPQAGEYSVVLDGSSRAVCVIRTDRVYMVPFREVSAEHACREGEGDLSLAHWREVHELFFLQEMKKAGLVFDEEMLVVCEEFSCVYALEQF